MDRRLTVSVATLVAPHETDEFRSIEVLDSTKTPVSTYHWQITPSGSRPIGSWLNPVSYAGQTGFHVAGLGAGSYALWIQITDGPYLVVLEPQIFYLD
jgi:hypothetical protein